MQVTRSSHKRYTQDQLTKVFIFQAGLTDGETKRMQQIWWVNPTDPDSLRLSFHGLKLVKSVLKMESFEFDLPENVTNHSLLQLERVFGGMYFLLKRQKLIVFEEQEAMMLTLHGNDIKNYLEHLESTNG